MEQRNRKKSSIIMGLCIAAGVCVIGITVAAVFVTQRNPLAKGLINLAKEVTALEEEMGEHFWTDAVNQIGSENTQAEYSVNIGGIPKLQNITIGVDGKVRRDMERKLFDAEMDFSVANAEIAQAFLLGTSDTLYLQVPSVWEGSVVFDTENISGQWNESAAKAELQLLAGQELGIGHRIDVEPFCEVFAEPFSFVGFLEENSEELRALYKNMEVMKLKTAQKKGLLSEKQKEELESYVLNNRDGEQIETSCYLVVLPERELRDIFSDLVGEIRLGVYLDGEKRIVRICTLPGEIFVTDLWEGKAAVHLTGTEATTDRVELEAAGTADAAAAFSAQGGGNGIFSALSDEAGDSMFRSDAVFTEGTIVLEKNREAAGAYEAKCSISVTERDDVLTLSLEGNIKGERVDSEEKLSVEVENCVLKLQNEVIFRGSGRAVFMPLTEEIRMPESREYRIGEMKKWETARFLAECTKNVYENYSGYLRMIQ